MVDWHFCAVFGSRIFLNVIEFSTSKIRSFSDAESVTVSIVPGVGDKEDPLLEDDAQYFLDISGFSSSSDSS